MFNNIAINKVIWHYLIILVLIKLTSKRRQCNNNEPNHSQLCGVLSLFIWLLHIYNIKKSIWLVGRQLVGYPLCVNMYFLVMKGSIIFLSVGLGIFVRT